MDSVDLFVTVIIQGVISRGCDIEVLSHSHFSVMYLVENCVYKIEKR